MNVGCCVRRWRGRSMRSEISICISSFLDFRSISKSRACCLERYPALPVVLDHGMKPRIRAQDFEPWATEIAVLARETTVLCKLSALVTEAPPGWTLPDLKPYVDHIIAAFGPDRVMWGSDWPVVNLNGSYDAWRAVTLALVGAHPGSAAILGGTAERFYRLGAV